MGTQESMEKEPAAATAGVLLLQQPKQVVSAPDRKQKEQEVNVDEECMQEGVSQVSDKDLVGREEALVGRELQVGNDANQDEHGQEAMGGHLQQKKPRQHPLQEEPPASASPAPWPPPLPAERDAEELWEDKGLSHLESTVGKVPDVGLVGGTTQPQ